MTTQFRSFRLATAALALGGLSSPATAELPDAVRAMIEAAVETGDPDKVAAVVEAAKATNPDEIEAIDAIFADFRAEQRELAAAEAAAERDAIREAGLFDRWEGEGQIGAFQSSGNTDSIGITAALKLERVGIDWRHKLRAMVDYQETNEVTTREQFLFAYEPRYQIDKGLFAFGLAQYERDRFQGFSGRYAVSGGLGYQVIDRENLQLSVKAGPAWRRTEFVGGGAESRLAALAGIDFEWGLTDAISLTQTTDLVTEGGGQATAFIDSNNTTLNLVTGLEAGITNALTTRLSYAVEYDSNPPAGAESTDTLTRFTLIYGF